MSKAKATDTKSASLGRDVQTNSTDVEADERMVPDVHKGHQIYGEHISRYAAAADLVKGKRVLDIASGTGYGTKQLAQTAKEVIGVDISENAIAYSNKFYGAKNIEYRLGDGHSIPLEDNSVDVVVSFETIEHIADYEKFIDESDRVLRDDGLFVVSTPNDKEFTQGNHFHLHQFTEAELKKLLEKRFKYVELYYQSTWLFSLIGDESTFNTEWEDTIEVAQTTTVKNDRVLYFYFLCSNRQITEKVKTAGAIGELWSERTVHEKERLTSDHVKNLENLLKDREAWIAKLENDLHQYDKTGHRVVKKIYRGLKK